MNLACGNIQTRREMAKQNAIYVPLLVAVSGSTSGLKHHLQTMHPDVVARSNEKQPTLSSFGVQPQRRCNESRQEKITVLLSAD